MGCAGSASSVSAPAMSCCAWDLDLITADSRDEAIFMLKEGKADAYLAELPMLNRLQAMAGMALARIDWMRDTSSPWAVAPRNDVLQGLLSGPRGISLP